MNPPWSHQCSFLCMSSWCLTMVWWSGRRHFQIIRPSVEKKHQQNVEVVIRYHDWSRSMSSSLSHFHWNGFSLEWWQIHLQESGLEDNLGIVMGTYIWLWRSGGLDGFWRVLIGLLQEHVRPKCLRRWMRIYQRQINGLFNISFLASKTL